MAQTVNLQSEEEMPHAVVLRIMKGKLSKEENFAGMSKDSRLAMAKASTVFARLLVNTANSFCTEDKRTTLAPKDVYKALKLLQMEDMMPTLEKFENDVEKALGPEKEKRRKIAAKRKAKKMEEQKEKEEKKQKTDGPEEMKSDNIIDCIIIKE